MSRLYDIFCECGSRVVTDSRKVGEGELFFALRGENFDGNRYALSALEGGAKWAVVDSVELEGAHSNIVVVEDSLRALQELAREHRERLGVKIVALTGTNGKTTTKELLACSLATCFENVGATEGNLNNHIGVPLTLLSFTEKTDVGVVEMGANHPGEIAQLCEIARPDAGLITNVGRAHLEGFGSVEAIISTKGELYDFLQKSGGMAIYNGDDSTLSAMIKAREGLLSVKYSTEGVQEIPLKLFGGYNQRNALGARAVACYLGGSEDKITEALSQYTPRNNRSEVIEKTPHGNRVVVDCYNANPSSMEVAQSEFLAESSTMPKVMILGGMRELGDYSEVEHLRVVERALVAAQSLFIGEEFYGIVPEKSYLKNLEEAKSYLSTNPLSNVAILLKGSRSNRLEELLPLI